MTQSLDLDTLSEPVHRHMRTDFVSLESTLTVDEALNHLREHAPSGRIIYFYVIDVSGKLAGVVPTRRLLLSRPEKRLSEIMIKPVIAIPKQATVLDACEFFILHKLLAFPVVDESGRMIGLVDVELYTEELSNLDRRENQSHLFQLLGIQLEARQQSVSTLFRRRFPWLIASLAGGLAAAGIIDTFYQVASLRLVVPFIPLVLALASSVTAQSVSLALQTLQGGRPTFLLLLSKLRNELATSALLGASCGVLTGVIVLAWKPHPLAIFALVASIAVSLICAAVVGLAIPYLFRLKNRSSQVAAGPLALALVDAVSLLVYFTIARWLVS